MVKKINNNNFIAEDGEKIKDINCSIKKEFNFPKIIGFLDFNEVLYAVYDSSSIYFIDKAEKDIQKDKIKFEIKEPEFKNIKICKKYDENNFILLTDNYLSLITIVENREYMINKKIKMEIRLFDFTSNLDLIFGDYAYDTYTIHYLFNPEYKQKENLLNIYRPTKIQIIKDDLFFIFENGKISSYLIKENKVNKLNEKSDIKTDDKSSIIDLNDLYYAFNHQEEIYILNKKNLDLIKTINLNLISNNIIPLTFFVKINGNNVIIFVFKDESVYMKNYEISMEGIKWDSKNDKNVIKEKINNIIIYENKAFFIGTDKAYLNEIEIEKNK
jgi:hypothetical protein